MATKLQRQLEAEWQAVLKRHAAPLERGAKAKGVKVAAKVVAFATTGRVTAASLPKATYDSLRGSTAPKASPVYTGSNMLGVGVMHKSSAVPIFSTDEAESLARMRR